MNFKAKIKSREELKTAVRQEQTAGLRVVQCHGCFDVLHPGHIRYLEFAKSQGDRLVVSITADKFILKGDDRPYMPQELRVNSMAALEIVDYVYLDHESWAGPILEHVQPDIYIKGKEYENRFSGNFGAERKIVDAYGGKVLFSSGDVVFSSSRLIEDFKKKFDLDYEVFGVFCQRNKITLGGLENLIESFKNAKVLVIGDTILDEYNYCEVLDVSGEAPILSIRPMNTERYVGGAGIIAKHISKLGGTAHLISCWGEDEEGKYIEEDLQNDAVSFDHLPKKDQSTFKKVRFIGDSQKLLKVDYFKNMVLEPEEVEWLSKFIEQHHDANCIVIADFAYGFISSKLLDAIVAFAKANDIPVIADASGTLGGNISKFNDVFLITPTEKEARMALDDKTSGLSNVAHRLLKKTGCQNIIITLGANGLLLFKNKSFTVYGKEEQHLESEYVPAINKVALDPMGAGDAMVSMISLVTASGGNLAEAVYLGNINSSLEVSKLGNIAVTKDELLGVLQSRTELSHELVSG